MTISTSPPEPITAKADEPTAPVRGRRWPMIAVTGLLTLVVGIALGFAAAHLSSDTGASTGSDQSAASSFPTASITLPGDRVPQHLPSGTEAVVLIPGSDEVPVLVQVLTTREGLSEGTVTVDVAADSVEKLQNLLTHTTDASLVTTGDT